MPIKKSAQKYQAAYKRLLGLYPVSYQQRFAEPMLQTFSDLCHEHVQADKELFWFAMQTYIGTFIEIIKEHIKGGIMSNRAAKIRVLAVVSGLGAVLIVAGFIFISSDQAAQSIAPLSSLEQARELSKGKKDACLMDQAHAVDAVRADDGFFEFNDEKISKFEMSASSAIMDIPAGTEYKMTIHSYDGGVAKGAMAYEYGYGIYNYEIKKSPEAGEWELVSVVACERS